MKEIRICCLHENIRLYEKFKLNGLAIPFGVTTHVSSKSQEEAEKYKKKGSLRYNDSNRR